MEALDKISAYKSFYAYGSFKEFVTSNLALNAHKLSKISNNELSFYFVAGLELGNQFKTKED
jgi:CRISPR-associated protein Csh1